MAEGATASVVSRQRLNGTTELEQLSDGTTRAVITAAATAFQDTDGAWREMVLTPRASGNDHLVDANTVTARFPAVLDARSAVLFGARGKVGALGWVPDWAGHGFSARAEVRGNVVRYQPFAHATEEFTVLRGAVKHTLVLDDRAAAGRALKVGPGPWAQASGTLRLDRGLSLRPAMSAVGGDFATEGAIDVLGPTGAVLFQLAPPRVYETRSQGALGPARYVWLAATRQLSIQFEAAWLDAPGRQFPIAVDPPATVLTGYASSPVAQQAGGPGWFSLGPDAPMVGHTNTGLFAVWALKFDLSALTGGSASGVAFDAFLGSGGAPVSMQLHLAKLTRDPQATAPLELWEGTAHGGAAGDYAFPPVSSGNCNCWLGGGTGVVLGGSAVNDLNFALAGGGTRPFLLAVHPAAFGGGAEVVVPDGLFEANPPRLYVTMNGSGLAAPAVKAVFPKSIADSTASTVVVQGANFSGGADGGVTARLVFADGGTLVNATRVDYLSDARVRVRLPAITPVMAPKGNYELKLDFQGRNSNSTPEAYLAVVNATPIEWKGRLLLPCDWMTGACWTGNAVPGPFDDVVIKSSLLGGLAGSPDITGAMVATAHSVTVESGDLTLTSGTLNVTESLAVLPGATLVLNSPNTLSVGGNLLAAPFSGPPSFLHATPATTEAGPRYFGGQLIAYDDFEELTVPSALPAGDGGVTVGADAGFVTDDPAVIRGQAISWTPNGTGVPGAWHLQDVSASSPVVAWFSDARAPSAGMMTLTSSPIDTTGFPKANLSWRHRYGLPLRFDQAGAGLLVRVSTNGGSSWLNVGPGSGGSVGPTRPQASCASGGMPITVGAMFAGSQPEWVAETVTVPSSTTLTVQFVAEWDGCSNGAPREGVFIDDVLLTGGPATPLLTLPNFDLQSNAKVTPIVDLTVTGQLLVGPGGRLDLSGVDGVAGAVVNGGGLVVGSGGLVVTGTLTNSGVVVQNGAIGVRSGLNSTGGVATWLGLSGSLFVDGGVIAQGPFVGPPAGFDVGGLQVTAGVVSAGRGPARIRGNLTVGAGTAVFRVASQGVGPHNLDVAGSISNYGLMDVGAASLTLVGPGLTSINGAGTFRSSTSRTPVFFDDFESGSFALRNWTRQSAPSATADSAVVAASLGTGSGNFVACLNCGVSPTAENFLRVPVGANGQTGLWLRYTHATSGTQVDALVVQYSVDSGLTWKIAAVHRGAVPQPTSEAVNLSALDPAVDSAGGALWVGFLASQQVGSGPALQYVDDVSVEASSPGLGPVTVNTGFSSQTNFLATNFPGATVGEYGPLTVQQGTLRIQGGALALRGKVDHSVRPGAMLAIEGGGTLQLDPDANLVVDGTLTMLGVGSPAHLTSTDPSVASRYRVTVNGTFNGNYFEIDSPGPRGLELTGTSTVQNLDGGRFHHPAQGGYLLTLNPLSAPFGSVNNTTFQNENLLDAGNVDGSAWGGSMRFDKSVGNLAGEAFDLDSTVAAGTSGNISWGPTHLTFVTPNRTFIKGVCGGAAKVLSVKYKDASEVDALFGLGATVQIISQKANTVSVNTNCVPPLNGMASNVGAAAVGADFYYLGDNAGSDTLTARTPGMIDGVQVETVLDVAPDHLGISTPLRTFTAGACPGPMGVITVELRDTSDKLTGTNADVTIDAASDSPGMVRWFTDPGCGAAAANGRFTLPAGSGSVDLYYQDDNAGARQLTFSANKGLGTVAQLAKVVAGMPTRLKFLGVPQAVSKDQPFTIAVEVEDDYGNRATGWTGDLKFDATDALATLPPPASYSALDQGLRTFDLGVALHSIGTFTLGVSDVQNLTLLAPARSIDIQVRDPNGPPFIVDDVVRTAGRGVPWAYNGTGRITALGARPMQFSACPPSPPDFRVDVNTGAVQWTPTVVGGFPLCVQARNGVAPGTDQLKFTVQVTEPTGAGPVADFFVTPDDGPTPLRAQFDSRASRADPSTRLVAWRWDFGDGSPRAFGPLPVDVYLAPGGYAPRLTVVDGFGRTASTQRGVTVRRGAGGPKPPTARIVATALSGRDSLDVGFSCDCTAGDAPISATRWDFDTEVVGGDPVVKTFGPGTHLARLTVVDLNGLSATDSVAISVTQQDLQPPVCRLGLVPPAGKGPLSVQHTADFNDPDATVGSAEFEFYDGTRAAAASPATRTYGQVGQYPVALLVKDSQGLTCRDGALVKVLTQANDLPPRIVSVPPTEAECSERVTYVPAAEGTGPFTWSLGEPRPSGLEFDADTGTLTWKVSPAAVQTVLLTVDSAAGRDEQNVSLDVSCPNGVDLRPGGCGCGTQGPAAAALALLLALRQLSRKASRKKAL